MSSLAPGSAKQHLGTVQPRPIGQMVMYIGILGLLGVIGTIIGQSFIGISIGIWGAYKVPLVWSAIGAILGWIGTIVAIVGGGMIIAAMSQGMVGRQVTNDEAVTLAGLAATPILLAGIFNIIPMIGGIVGLIALLYSAMLFYMGAGARFGADKAIVTTIIYIVAVFVIMAIFGMISGAIMASMMLGSLGGLGSMGAANYGSGMLGY